MFVLPPALDAMRAYRQFIIFKLVPSQTRPGKTDKIPTDWRSATPHDAHDPAIWLSDIEAAATAEVFGPEYGVGFVFTVADPFWFLDIDDCLKDGKWSDAAMAILSRFPGCAIEISASGKGLHLFGSGVAPPHKTRYDPWFEFYTENRFAALTGTGAMGDAATVHTPALAVLVAEYLTRDPNERMDELTDAPRADWRGSADDQELIKRAMRSVSGRAAMGNAASFADLFTADADKLAKFFPPDSNGKGAYNASSADSALAQSLAFWTGNHGTRMERIMRLSALARDKWDDGGYYLDRTIRLVCGRQYEVCIDALPEPVAGPVAIAGAAEATKVTGETFLGLDQQIELFKGCVYVEPKHKALILGGKLLRPEQFRARFGGYVFPMDAANQKISRNAWEVFTESNILRCPYADAVTFRPELPPAVIIEEAGQRLVNTWWPIETPRADGDATPFLAHMAKLFPDVADRAILLAYMAAVLQYPGVKFQWAPFIQGVEGNGKTFLCTAMVRAVGERYCHLPNTQDLAGNGGKFTGWLEQKLFIGLEEIYTADRREVLDILKPLITNKRTEIQAKGADQITGDNRANFMAFSNHKDAIPKTTNDRRWGIFFCAQHEFADLHRDGMDGEYMNDLWNWAEGGGFAIINGFLREYAIPDELNPATKLHRAPDTSSTREAVGMSIGAIEQEVIEAVEQGLPGFAGGWVSSMMLDKLLQRIGAERRLPLRRRRELLQGLGYDWHKAFPDGRVLRSVSPDGGKPRLFIKKSHLAASIATVDLATKTYEDAQARALTDKANFGALDPIDGTGNKG